MPLFLKTQKLWLRDYYRLTFLRQPHETSFHLCEICRASPLAPRTDSRFSSLVPRRWSSANAARLLLDHLSTYPAMPLRCLGRSFCCASTCERGFWIWAGEVRGGGFGVRVVWIWEATASVDSKFLVWGSWIYCSRVEICQCCLNFVLTGRVCLLWIFRRRGFIASSTRFRSAASASASQSINYAWWAFRLGLLIPISSDKGITTQDRE